MLHLDFTPFITEIRSKKPDLSPAYQPAPGELPIFIKDSNAPGVYLTDEAGLDRIEKSLCIDTSTEEGRRKLKSFYACVETFPATAAADGLGRLLGAGNGPFRVLVEPMRHSVRLTLQKE